MTPEGRRTLARLAGEFLIIVTGVLVALGVDGWREGRAERAREIAYYHALAEDLERDLEEYDFALQMTARSIGAANHVGGVIRGEIVPDPERSLRESLEYASWVNYPAWSSGTMDELIASGAIRLIRDAEIKRAMFAYYDLVEEWKPRLLGPEYGTFVEYRRLTRPYDTDVDPEIDDAAVARAIRGDQELLGVVAAMIDEWDVLTALLEDQREAAAELQTRVERELEGEEG